MRTSENINELAAALAKAQAEFKPVEKNCENPHFKSSFADLTAMKNEAQPKLAKHGLSVIQPPSNADSGEIIVTTRLMHSSGQFIEESLKIRPTKPDAQGAGSAITYGERYSYKSMVGLTVRGEDDDANAASGIQVGGKQSVALAPPPKPTQDVSPGDYVIAFGKHKGKKVRDISEKDLNDYAVFLNKAAKEKGAPLKGDVKDFLDNAEAWLMDTPQ